MINNFKCADCGHEIYISRYSISYNLDNRIFKQNNAVITCQNCKGYNMTLIPKPTPDAVYFAKFRAMSIEEKRKVLKARAKHHTNTVAKDHIGHIKQNFNGQNSEKIM